MRDYYDSTVHHVQHPLIEHWDGSSWSVVASPTPPSDSELEGVSGSSSSDIWAVGFEQVGLDVDPDGRLPMALHWDGSSWSKVAAPNVSALHAVATISPSDAWAVGENGSNWKAVIAHWDGGQWSLVSTPAPGDSSSLRRIAAVSANDVWAVGGFHDPVLGANRSLVLHWDGQTWSQVPTADAGAANGGFFDVATASDGAVWALRTPQGVIGTAPAVFGHWEGSAFATDLTPFPSYPYALAAAADGDVWARGLTLPVH